jgi:hypothetical protein
MSFGNERMISLKGCIPDTGVASQSIRLSLRSGKASICGHIIRSWKRTDPDMAGARKDDYKSIEITDTHFGWLLNHAGN